MISTNPDSPQNGSKDIATPRKRASPGSRLRSLVLGVALGLVVAIVAWAALMISTRKSTPLLTQAAYEAAGERWAKNAPSNYDLDLERAGTRSGKIHVEVRNGEIVHMTSDGVEPRQQRTWFPWSVPGQLDTIGQELEMARHPAASFHNRAITQMVMWAEFDPKFGYPRRYDRVVLGADYEVHWWVTRFEALPEK